MRFVPSFKALGLLSDRRLLVAVIGVWVGCIICAGGIVAPAIFQSLETKTAAGHLFGSILRRLNQLELAFILIYAGTRFLLWTNGDREKFRKMLTSDWLFLLMTLSWIYYAHVLTPEMQQIQSQTQNTMMSGLSNTRFDILHIRYKWAMSANLFMGVSSFFVL